MLNEHELRRAIVGEMHLRRWPQLASPAVVIQFVHTVDAADRGLEQAAINDLPEGGRIERHDNPRHLSGWLAPGVDFTVERHSEARTTTLFIDGGEIDAMLAPDADALLKPGFRWASSLPGKVIRSTRVMLVAGETEAAGMLRSIGFAEEDLVSCYIGTRSAGPNRARIWSDFYLRQQGFGAILVAANGMPPGDLARTVQRLQELGNYRNLALLGLPVARRGWAALDRIENMLSDMLPAVARPDITDDALLERVTSLSMELISHATDCDYRMSATEAYARLVEERLADLNIEPCDGHLSLADFTQRRFLPAVRTCAAHRRRAEQLAQRTTQFVSLFRTRIETRIENQNGRLLASMERNAARQLRLQQVVEGLSVVAVSYYALALLDKVLEGIKGHVKGLDVDIVSALLVPVILLSVWLALHRMKRRILDPLGH